MVNKLSKDLQLFYCFTATKCPWCCNYVCFWTLSNFIKVSNIKVLDSETSKVYLFKVMVFNIVKSFTLKAIDAVTSKITLLVGFKGRATEALSDTTSKGSLYNFALYNIIKCVYFEALNDTKSKVEL